MSVSEPLKVHFRWMILADLRNDDKTSSAVPRVVEIEKLSFSEPWTAKEIRDRNHTKIAIGMVAEINSVVVAFFMYDMYESHLQIINIAVHPDWRGKGIGRQIIEKMKGKLNDKRTYLTALVPEACKDSVPFFEKYGIKVRMTKKKGELIYSPILSAMESIDVPEVQSIENEFMDYYGKPRRNIAELLTEGSHGIIARDELSHGLLGFVLYKKDETGISFNGEFGIIVKKGCRGQGVGRKLMMKLAEQNLLITVENIYLPCKDQTGFLRAMGVEIPQPVFYHTTEWKPKA